tara:strand:- start:259 stop:2529 length:2271 start_codon:yes stop_codon:yes gene_type:complete
MFVYLQEEPVGKLTLSQKGEIEFRLLDSYKQMVPRPTLGQTFLDHLDKEYRTRMRLIPWFSNLLPEGLLRELVAKQAAVHTEREFFLLHHLGKDLPGAVRVLPEQPLEGFYQHTENSTDGMATEEEEDAQTLRFSLAGVQLKFSASRKDRGLTIPAKGIGGDWIVKLPDQRYKRVPENEWSMMTWAKKSGIDVPEFDLFDTDDIQGLPPEHLHKSEKLAFAIKRFDRPEPSRRVHIEDFAQIFGLYPQEKYDKFSYNSIAKILLAVTNSEKDFEEYVRRLLFIILSGNADAHHKNWSLIYPDNVKARLSPAYDFVSTIQYIHNDKLALNLQKSKRWEDVSARSFVKMFQKLQSLGFLEERTEDEIKIFIENTVVEIMTAWSTLEDDLPLEEEAKERLRVHWGTIPLMKERVRPPTQLRLSDIAKVLNKYKNEYDYLDVFANEVYELTKDSSPIELRKQEDQSLRALVGGKLLNIAIDEESNIARFSLANDDESSPLTGETLTGAVLGAAASVILKTSPAGILVGLLVGALAGTQLLSGKGESSEKKTLALIFDVNTRKWRAHHGPYQEFANRNLTRGSYAFLKKEPWTMLYLRGLPFPFRDFLKQLDPKGPLSNNIDDWDMLTLSEDRNLPSEYIPLRVVHTENIVKKEERFEEVVLSTNHSHWGKLVGEQTSTKRTVQVLMDREVLYSVRGQIIRAYDLVKLDKRLWQVEYSASFREGDSLVRFEDSQVWRIQKIIGSHDEDWIQFVCVPFQKDA